MLRTYFNSYGQLAFCTLDGVQIEASDPKMKELVAFAEAAYSDSGLTELFDGFEGSLDDLYNSVTSRYSLVDLMIEAVVSGIPARKVLGD